MIELETQIQTKTLEKTDIKNYGIVYTPNILVDQILDLIPPSHFQDPTLRWLDLGAGTGAFSINLYNRLFKNLENEIPDPIHRKNHIIKNMLYLTEIYPEHILKLQQIFKTESTKPNIINRCFLSINKSEYEPFDFIIGNPPYNTNGQIKTPTNSKLKKTDDGKAIYVEFVYKSLELLKPTGFLNLIIPSLWLKPDKAGLYNTLTQLKINKLHCLSTSETNKAFNYQAQTPTCFFLCSGEIAPHAISENNNANKTITIYDKLENTYIPYILKPDYPIPTHGITIINKLMPFIDKYDHLKVLKSNTPSKKTILSTISGEINDNNFKYQNIKTTILNQTTPELVINYSNIPQHFFNQPKLILAHKMYGFPFLDQTGEYGISTRDNYLLTTKDYSLKELKQIQTFLSTKFALFIFSTTNYRMRYLERYAFQFIPDITKIQNFPNLMNETRINRDKIISKFFNLSTKERETIENLSKDYNFFN